MINQTYTIFWDNKLVHFECLFKNKEYIKKVYRGGKGNYNPFLTINCQTMKRST